MRTKDIRPDEQYTVDRTAPPIENALRFMTGSKLELILKQTNGLEDYPGPLVMDVVEVGVERMQRKDGVRVRFTDAFVRAADAVYDRQNGYVKGLTESFVVSSKHVTGSKAEWDEVQCQRQSDEEREAANEKERLGALARSDELPAHVGQAIEQSEREAARAASNVREQIEEVIKQGQKALEEFDYHFEDNNYSDDDRGAYQRFWSKYTPKGLFPLTSQNDLLFFNGAMGRMSEILDQYRTVGSMSNRLNVLRAERDDDG